MAAEYNKAYTDAVTSDTEEEEEEEEEEEDERPKRQ